MRREINTSTNHNFLFPLLLAIEQVLTKIEDIEYKIEFEDNPKDEKIEKLEEENKELREKITELEDKIKTIKEALRE